jgi:Niemann-Pick C1 protein
MQKFKYILDNLIGRCPSCYYNLLRILCEMACSPDQDEFLWPLETINITRPNEVEQIISDDNGGALFEADADYVDPDEVKEEAIEKLPSKPIETVNVINKIRYFVSEKQAQDFIDSCW